MKLSVQQIFFVAAALLLLAAAPSVYAATVDCSDGVISYSPSTLWPPNHKLQPIAISYTVGDSDGDISIHVDSITENDEPANNGCGPSNNPDWTGVGLGASGADNTSVPVTITGVQLRAERCGTGDGRTYTIHMSCCDDSFSYLCEEPGTADLTVTVPHNQ
jgi:hypothetical protein